MNGKNFYASMYSAALLLMAVPVSLCITSCSDTISENESEDSNEVQFNVSFENKPTRAVTTPAEGINTFYLYAFQGNTIKGYNIQYNYNGSAWKAKGLGVTWPKTDPLNIFGLTESFLKVLKDRMTSVRAINYYIPPVDAHDVWYASALKQLKSQTGGTINLKFTRLVSRVNFSCKNSMQNMSVRISEIVVHNLVSAGTFTFSEKTASAGSWKLLNTGENPYYANYPQAFKTNLEPGIVRADVLPLVPPKTNSKLITDSAFILIPQTTVKWKPDTTTTPKQDIAYGDANHQCYVEVKCQIFETDENGVLGDCVWGDPTGVNYPEYESIYIPLLKTWSKSNNISNIVFDLATAYNADGSPWAPHEGSEQIRFDESMLLEPILDSGVVDVWDEDEAFELEL